MKIQDFRFNTMHEHPPVSHRIIFLAIFAASCLLLTISYYDNSFLSFNSVYITDQEDFYVAAKNTTNAYNSTPTIITTTIPHNITAVTTSPPKNEPHEGK
ncbi:hypothetical protein JTB14_023582 [Gonioctena quinquepunctata]|nr:hypothetical protein JTB14_023582 [Gonioctena quinquepunctata]